MTEHPHLTLAPSPIDDEPIRSSCTVEAGCLVGITSHPVQVEARLAKGIPAFEIVGLPERGVRESRVRVKSALAAQGFPLPQSCFVLNLAPGDLRKSGSAFDLAIAYARTEQELADYVTLRAIAGAYCWASNHLRKELHNQRRRETAKAQQRRGMLA